MNLAWPISIPLVDQPAQFINNIYIFNGEESQVNIYYAESTLKAQGAQY